jgi:hypothetical protein
MTVEQPVDQVQIPRPTTPGADRKLARQVGLGARRKRSGFLMPDVYPLQLTALANSVRQSVERIAHDTVNALHAGSRKCSDENFCQGLCHEMSPTPQRGLPKALGQIAAS